jgi:glycosyltransferase involved in cell wall biosynthesis
VVGDKTLKNIVLLLTGGAGFPGGDAYTNRVLAFAKGFKINNCLVTILIIYPGKTNTVPAKGEFDGIPYFFVSTLTPPPNYLLRKSFGAFGIYRAISFLRVQNKKQKIDLLISFSQSPIQNVPIYFFSKLNKIIFLRENNEYPNIVFSRGIIKLKWYERIYLKWVYKSFDGHILINHALNQYSKSLLSKNTPTLIVPIIVEANRFKTYNLKPKKYISYSGNLYGEKDGITILIDAFAIISKVHVEYKLRLIGDTSNLNELKILIDRIEKLCISDKVEFTGFVQRDKVPDLLGESAVLCLARPNNIQAQGGFPTKLGEYLGTGRPVVVTDTSDISLYLKDGINAFIAEPGSIQSFADKLLQVLGDYEKASQVGLKGKLLTLKEFNNEYQSARILEFADNLIQ